MTPDLLDEVGRALYGPQWQSEMARELGVAIRTVQRWAVGNYPPPPGVAFDLGDLLRKRRGDLAILAKKLPRRPKKPG